MTEEMKRLGLELDATGDMATCPRRVCATVPPTLRAADGELEQGVLAQHTLESRFQNDAAGMYVQWFLQPCWFDQGNWIWYSRD